MAARLSNGAPRSESPLTPVRRSLLFVLFFMAFEGSTDICGVEGRYEELKVSMAMDLGLSGPR